VSGDSTYLLLTKWTRREREREARTIGGKGGVKWFGRGVYGRKLTKPSQVPLGHRRGKHFPLDS